MACMPMWIGQSLVFLCLQQVWKDSIISRMQINYLTTLSSAYALWSLKLGDTTICIYIYSIYILAKNGQIQRKCSYGKTWTDFFQYLRHRKILKQKPVQFYYKETHFLSVCKLAYASSLLSLFFLLTFEINFHLSPYLSCFWAFVTHLLICLNTLSSLINE